MLPDAPMVVACMGEGVSTPWAYGELDRLYSGFTEKRAVSKGVELAKAMHCSENRITGILFRTRKKLRNFLEKEGYRV